MNELVLANRAADWRRLKMLVLDSVSSPITKRVYLPWPLSGATFPPKRIHRHFGRSTPMAISSGGGASCTRQADDRRPKGRCMGHGGFVVFRREKGAQRA
jgi:hypothetical protein